MTIKGFESTWNNMIDNPKQPEWAKLMAQFQQTIPDHDIGWIKMECIYTLY